MLHHMPTGTLYAHYRGYGVEHSPLTAEAQIILKPKDANLSALESVQQAHSFAGSESRWAKVCWTLMAMAAPPLSWEVAELGWGRGVGSGLGIHGVESRAYGLESIKPREQNGYLYCLGITEKRILGALSPKPKTAEASIGIGS